MKGHKLSRISKRKWIKLSKTLIESTCHNNNNNKKGNRPHI